MTHEQRDAIERELARRFHQLRREEGLSLPALPDELPVRRATAYAAAGWRNMVPVGAAMAAAILVALVAFQRPQSPDALYRDVMDASVLVTDSLLSVSPVALPEKTGTPALYDPRPATSARHDPESRRI